LFKLLKTQHELYLKTFISVWGHLLASNSLIRITWFLNASYLSSYLIKCDIDDDDIDGTLYDEQFLYAT